MSLLYILRRETDKSISGLGLGREHRGSPNSSRSANYESDWTLAQARRV